MDNKKKIIFLAFVMILFVTTPTEALILINEILADPPAGSNGDANADGVRSAIDDEFIELLNYGDHAVDISGWYVTDAAQTRHLFPASTSLSAYGYFVIFGGGSPSLSEIDWQIAISGSLGLNNSGDTVTLFDSGSTVMSQVVYGSLADKDSSIVRFPEGIGTEFVLHSSLEQSQGALYSPGTGVDGNSLNHSSNNASNNAVVPEIATILYFGLGGMALLFRRKA
jgi:hypothetical protein